MDTEGEAADVTEDVVGSQDEDNPEEEVDSTVWPPEFSELPQGEAQTSVSMTAWLKDDRNKNFQRWEHAIQTSKEDWPELIKVITTLSSLSKEQVEYYLKMASEDFLVTKKNCLRYVLSLNDRKVIGVNASDVILLNMRSCDWIKPLTDWMREACTSMARKSVFKWKKVERVRQTKARKALGQTSRKASVKKASALSTRNPFDNILSKSITESAFVRDNEQAAFVPASKIPSKRKTDREYVDMPALEKLTHPKGYSRIRLPKSESTLSDREPTPFSDFLFKLQVKSPKKETTRTDFSSIFPTSPSPTLPEKRSEMLYQECIEVLVKDIGEEEMELDDPDSLIISLSCCIKEEAKGFQHSYIRAVHLDFEKFCSALEGLDEAFRIGTEKELRWLNWDGEERIVKDVYDFQFAVGQMWMMKNEDERNMVMRIERKRI